MFIARQCDYHIIQRLTNKIIRHGSRHGFNTIRCGRYFGSTTGLLHRHVHHQQSLVTKFNLLTPRPVSSYSTDDRVLDVMTSKEAKEFIINHEAKKNTAENIIGFITNYLRTNPIDLSIAKSVLYMCSSDCLPSLSAPKRQEMLNELWAKVTDNRHPSLPELVAYIKTSRDNQAILKDYRHFQKDFLVVSPTKEVYESLLAAYCEIGNMSEATSVMADMKKNGIPITTSVLNLLILGHSRNKKLTESEAVSQTFTAANITQNSFTKMEFIRAYIENGNKHKALELLKQNGNTLSDSQLIQIIKSIVLHGMLDILPDAMKFLSKDLRCNKDVAPEIQNLCLDLCVRGLRKRAYDIINELPVPEIQPNEDTDNYCVFLINQIVNDPSSPFADISSICRSLVTSKRNTRALHVATEIALRKNTPHQEQLLEDLMKLDGHLRSHYFWPLFIRSFNSNSETGILNVLKLMHKLKVDPDFDTVNQFVLPKLTITLRNIEVAMKLLDTHKIKTSHLITPILVYLLQQHRVKEVIYVLTTYPTKVNGEQLIWPLIICSNLIKGDKTGETTRDLMQAVKLIGEKNNNTRIDVASYFFMDLVSHSKIKQNYPLLFSMLDVGSKLGIQMSGIAGDLLQQHFGKSSDQQAKFAAGGLIKKMTSRKINMHISDVRDQQIHHPKDMSVDELEAHLVELQAKNLNVRGVLRRLLQSCVRENRFQRALEVKRMCDEQKVDASAGMLASVFDLMVKTKSCREAEVTLAKLTSQYPGFLIDEHKIIDYAALLVESGDVEKAKLLLKKRGVLSSVKGGANLHKNIWQLLSNVAYYAAQHHKNSEENMTEKFYDFLSNLGYCSHHNTLMGPVLREFILKKNIKAAVRKYQYYAKEFRKTPLQQELCTLLVYISNLEDGQAFNEFRISVTQAKIFLQSVIDASALVHGFDNSNLTLIIALAEAGTEKQLRKALMDPMTRLNSQLLVKQCEHMTNKGKVDALVKLAKCSRGIGHSIREEDLYNMLMLSFSKDNNCDAALSLYDHLLNDDEYKMSQSFLRNLVDMLERNNILVPSQVTVQLRSK